jgi:hypothetical protein
MGHRYDAHTVKHKARAAAKSPDLYLCVDESFLRRKNPILNVACGEWHQPCSVLGMNSGSVLDG